MNFGLLRAREPSLPEFGEGERRTRLVVTRHPRARRMKVTIDSASGAVRLTLPPRASLSSGLKWIETRREWIEDHLGRRQAGGRIAPGAMIPFEGRDLRIDWSEAFPRTVRQQDDRLVVGGPAELVAGRVLRWLRSEAARRLGEETRILASRHAIAIGRIGVGDARTRWGSCSASGDIRYNWRLILAPTEVRAAVVAHELAHRRHMDHSPAFHAAVAALLGRDPVAERAWLRANGAALHGFGRAS